MGRKKPQQRWVAVRGTVPRWNCASIPDAAGPVAPVARSGESHATSHFGPDGTGMLQPQPILPALSLTTHLQMTHLHTLPPPPPPQQVDVIFALAKGNWHCGNPLCRKPLDPWAAPGADNAMCIAREENYIYHDGLRGPTAADNNIKTEFCCGMCMRKGEA